MISENYLTLNEIIHSTTILSMKTFPYKDYIKLFGNRTRPALIRNFNPNEDNKVEGYTVYIDGKSQKYEHLPTKRPDKLRSIVLLKPLLESNINSDEDNLVVIRFNPDSAQDWEHLIHETFDQHKRKDPLAHALLAIALDKYDWKEDMLEGVLSASDNEVINVICEMVNAISWSLSPNNMAKIKNLVTHFGKTCNTVFPPILEETAKRYNIKFADYNVHTTADLIFTYSKEHESNSDTPLCRLIKWFESDKYSFSLSDLETCYPYLSEFRKALAIKRFFADIKKGLFKYNDEILDIFDTPNSDYYSLYRYIFTRWPSEKNVSIEFLADCIKTYKKTKETNFQVNDGVMDWAMQRSFQLMRPLDLRFGDWMNYCKGGIILNDEFKGFADFDLQYQMNDFAFEDESVQKSFVAIRDRYSMKSSQTKTDQWEILPLSSESKLWIDNDPYEGRAKFDRARQLNKRFIDIFVDWSKKPSDITNEYVFTQDMIISDGDIIRNNVELYLKERYGTLTPYISERETDDIVKMFMYGCKIKASINHCANLKEDIGISDWDARKNVENRLRELLGDTLECDYDPEILKTVQTESLYKRNGSSNECLRVSYKRYYKNKSYCAADLSDSTLAFTKRRFAICDRNECLKTALKKDPKWQDIGLIHILDIMGYEVFEETDAGYFPNKAYRNFTYQVNKSIRFYKRLICRDCGHILFKSNNYGNNRYTCLNPSCHEYKKEIYISNCHNCNNDIIDSRDTKQCPNGLYICPACGSCCSNKFFESLALKYQKQGKPIPKSIAINIGKGHADLNMEFCHRCGSQKAFSSIDKSGKKIYLCPNCDKEG